MTGRCSVSQTLDSYEAALGAPAALREIGRHGRLLGAVGVWRHRGAEIDAAALSSTRIVLNLTSGQTIAQRDRGRWLSLEARAGDVAVVVPSSGVSRIAVGGEAGTLQIVLSRDMVAAETRRSGLAALPASERASHLKRLALQTLVALGQPVPDAAGTLALLTALTRFVSPNPPSGSPPLRRGGLSPTAMQRVERRLDRSLQDDRRRVPSVPELADAGRLSLFHFIRAFHATTGQTPQVWARARRLDHAVRLLLENGQAVAEAADRVGFATPAHFVSAFRRRFGVTPGAVRDAARSSVTPRLA